MAVLPEFQVDAIQKMKYFAHFTRELGNLSVSIWQSCMEEKTVKRSIILEE